MPLQQVGISIELSDEWKVLEDLLSPKEFERIVWRTMARATRDISRIYVRHLKAEIRASTTRRTGALLAAKAKTSRRRDRLQITLAPNFPRTAYETPPGVGRGGARKSGQYAFVLNSRYQFIQRATRAARADPQLPLVLNKHFAFILNQYLERRTPP